MSLMTMNWLRNYAHLHRMSSYMDKLTAMYEANNPYYLLEWLFFPAHREAMDAINFNRSPGMVRDSYLPFLDVFLKQQITHLAFTAFEHQRSHELMLQTAMQDLKAYHGVEKWKQAVQAWAQQLDIVWEKQAECERDIAAVKKKHQQQYESKILQLKLDLPAQSDVLEEQLLDAKAVYEQRVKEAINKLVFQDYEAWPLIAYIHVQQIDGTPEQLRWLANICLQDDEHMVITQFREHQFAELMRLLQQDDMLMKRFMQWIPAYASKTLMTAEHVNIDERQQDWLAWLIYLHEAGTKDETTAKLWDVTYAIEGISEAMMQGQQVPRYLHTLVELALKQNRRIKWLREAVVLRYWPVFFTAFRQQTYDFAQTSWLLCLDPESIEARFIRSYKQAGEGDAFDLSFVKERISQIFIDAVRLGIPLQMMAPLLKHLTIHHIDFIYAYIHNMKQADDFLPLLHMEDVWLQRIFAGHGIRATEARRAVLPIVLTWFDEQFNAESDELIWAKIRLIYQSHKAEVLKAWVTRQVEQNDAWPKEAAARLANWLHIRWLAPLDNEEETHEQITHWIAQHSEWVQFEREGQFEQQKGMTYTIVRPGYIDSETGQLLARVTIRAELTDPTLIASVLDDLKDL